MAEKKAAAKKAAAGSSSPKTGKGENRPAKSTAAKKATKAKPEKPIAEQEAAKPVVEPVDVSGPPRVGVFVCHCGINIAGFLDVSDVTEYAKTLPNVVFATRNLYTCAEDGISAIKDAIKGARTEPRGGCFMHTADTRAPLPRRLRGGRAQQVPFRVREHTRPVLLGTHA